VAEKVNFELLIDGFSHDGRGVARRDDGKAVFVIGALPGERVRARMTRKHRRYDEAILEEVIERSPDRVDPRCPHFGQCGGCALQHLSAGEQLRRKADTLKENLERIGEVKPKRWLEPLTGPLYGYRRKARLSVRYVLKKERVLVGFREGDGRYVADLSECHVLVPNVGFKLTLLAELIQSLEAREQIPQIELAAGDDATVLVVRHYQPLSDADRQKLLAFGNAHGFHLYGQLGGEDSIAPLDGEPVTLRTALGVDDLSLDFLPSDFVQVNQGLNARMIEHALGLLEPTAEESILDLFCGLGNFSLPIAKRCARVIGVEGDAGLVERARANAARQQIANVQYFRADLSQPLANEPWYEPSFCKALIDPPRSGAESVCRMLNLSPVNHLVYVSCHPASLARDAGILVREGGFKLHAAGVMDMFPHTGHVESIALFKR
jgi:23S rRNA (uracil1939-C5)-methyltransferase